MVSFEKLELETGAIKHTNTHTHAHTHTYIHIFIYIYSIYCLYMNANMVKCILLQDMKPYLS